MAKVQMTLPDDYLERLSKLGAKSDAIAESVLETGGDVVLAQVRSNLAASVGSGTKYKSRSTGELESSLGKTSVKTDKSGNHNIKIGFAEPRRDGESNAKLANIIEYGKHGQPAKPFLKPAKSSSKAACIEAMKAKFDEEVSKL